VAFPKGRATRSHELSALWEGLAVEPSAILRTSSSFVLPPDTGARARAMAYRIGERLLRCESADANASRGLGGISGNALTFGALATVTNDSRYWDAANRQLSRAARADDEPGIGLFSGLSGLRGVAAIFSRTEPQLQRLVAQCDTYIESALPGLKTAHVADMNTFDVIGGWSGARLARCVLGPAGRDRLIDLLAWLMSDDARWCKCHPMRMEAPPENDIGLAHGISGVLSAIALTVTDVEPDLKSLLESQTVRLASNSVRVGYVGWSNCLQAGGESPLRPAWCYGTPGVAAAIYWTSRLLGNEELESFSLDALESVAELPPGDWQNQDFAICHGTLGNALIFASVGAMSRRTSLLHGSARAVQYALDGLERDDGACYGVDWDLKVRDLSGELDGAAGVALALLTLCGDFDSTWLRLHALEPLS
jgi:lantibiotic biosynthesis protein